MALLLAQSINAYPWSGPWSGPGFVDAVSIFRELNRRAVKVVVVPRQEYQVSLEVLVPRDQQGSRDRSARKDL